MVQTKTDKMSDEQQTIKERDTTGQTIDDVVGPSEESPRSSLAEDHGVSGAADRSEGSRLSPSDGSAETEDDEMATDRETAEFYKNIVLRQQNVGQTLFDVIEKARHSADTVTQLSATESQYLDDLLFKGYVTHEFYLRENFPVRWRSTSPIAVQRGYDLLADTVGHQRKLSSTEACMLVAVYIESYGPDQAPLHRNWRGLDQKEFESEKEIEKRFEFASVDLGSTVVDTLQKRLQEFLDLLDRISQTENIVNF